MWGRSITGRSAFRPSLSTSIPTGAATTVTATSIAIVTATGIVATGIAIVTVVTGIVIGVIGTVIVIAIEIAATGAGIAMTGVGTEIARSVREIGIEIETAMTPPADTRPRSVGEFAWAARTADRVTDRL